MLGLETCHYGDAHRAGICGCVTPQSVARKYKNLNAFKTACREGKHSDFVLAEKIEVQRILKFHLQKPPQHKRRKP